MTNISAILDLFPTRLGPATPSASRLVDREAVEIKTARERLTRLEDRLARLLTTIQTEVQREGLSLAALQAGLRGRWKGACHPGELGSALRKLGFTRVRRWSGIDGFRAVWLKSR